MATWSFSTLADMNRIEDDEEFGSFQDSRGMRDHLLLMVDCSANMWSRDRSYALEVLKTVVEVYKTRAVNGSKDYIAIMLYGTREYFNANHEDHIVVLNPLQVPTAQNILDLQDLIKDGEEGFLKKYGTIGKNEFKMSDVFWEAKRTFPTNKHNMGIRRILLFTNEDDPHGDPKDEATMKRRMATQSRIKDLLLQNISIEVFGLDTPKTPFDYTKFYANVLGLDDDGIERTFKSYKSIVELDKMVRKRQYGKRALSKLAFELAEGVEISVSLYGLIVETRKPTYTYRDNKTLEPVQPQVVWTRSDNAQVVITAGEKYKNVKDNDSDQIAKQLPNKTQVLPAFRYAGSMIPFTQEQVQKMKTLFPNGLKLLCFKDKNSLRLDFNIKHPYFIYPDESMIKGSVQVFSSLLQTMYEMEKIAICRFQPRAGSAARLVALLPQIEIRSSDGLQENPPGFHLLILPFADDIRSMPQVEVCTETTQAVVDSMTAVINKLTSRAPFDPVNYPNPVLQNHYSVIEALALELDDPEPWVDALQPPIGQLEKCADFFSDLQTFIPDPPVIAKKRKGEDAADISKKKKKKDVDLDKDEMSEAIDEQKWLVYWKNKTLNKFQVKELKEFLQQQKIIPKKKKDELIEQVDEYFTNKNVNT